MRSRWVYRAVLALTALSIGVNTQAIAGAFADLSGLSSQDTEVAASPPQLALHESPSCAIRLDAAPPATARPPVPSGGTVVTFTIPATTSVMTDGGGRVVSVRTNTGCTPAEGDEMWEITPAGAVPVSAALRERVLSHPYDGDWTTPGEWHAVGPIDI